MAEYTLSEFRSNLRRAFEQAANGEEVTIDRYGEDFILLAKKNTSLPQAETESEELKLEEV